MMTLRNLFSISAICCILASILFLFTTHAANRHPKMAMFFAAIYVFVGMVIQLIIAFDKNIHNRERFHTPLTPLVQAIVTTFWVMLMIMVRFLDEYSPQSVAFFGLLAISVFLSNRVIQPTEYETGFFAFCCVSTVAQSFAAFGAVSLVTWLLVVATFLIYWVDYRCVAADTDARESVAPPADVIPMLPLSGGEALAQAPAPAPAPAPTAASGGSSSSVFLTDNPTSESSSIIDHPEGSSMTSDASSAFQSSEEGTPV